MNFIVGSAIFDFVILEPSYGLKTANDDIAVKNLPCKIPSITENSSIFTYGGEVHHGSRI